MIHFAESINIGTSTCRFCPGSKLHSWNILLHPGLPEWKGGGDFIVS